MLRVGKFALVVMVSAILASPSDRVRGREEERKKKNKKQSLRSSRIESYLHEYVLGLFGGEHRFGV